MGVQMKQKRHKLITEAGDGGFILIFFLHWYMLEILQNKLPKPNTQTKAHSLIQPPRESHYGQPGIFTTQICHLNPLMLRGCPNLKQKCQALAFLASFLWAHARGSSKHTLCPGLESEANNGRDRVESILAAVAQPRLQR